MRLARAEILVRQWRNERHEPVAARESSRHLADLLLREHGALADFLVALAEFDGTGSYRLLGYAHVFDYLVRELELSEGAAHYRKVAARLVGRFPEVVEPLRDGRLCLSSVLQLARVMTEANRAEVLPKFFHCSKQQAKQVAVEILPAAVVPRRTVITGIPAPVKSATSPIHPGEFSATAPGAGEADRGIVENPRRAAHRDAEPHPPDGVEGTGGQAEAGSGWTSGVEAHNGEQVIDAAMDLLLLVGTRRRRRLTAGGVGPGR